ncbi:prostaglandin E synthase isoform X3 [Anolis carolinensis]|uniref:prostaglandin E synthase isoform X3 n=1 Tax=Anolis carolinensis TaxID=28377 RepID=UPI002F2B8FF8
MENEAFASFLFFGTLLVLKMYAVAVITGQVRLRKKAFANPEDALRHGGLQYHREDPDVERCLRKLKAALDSKRHDIRPDREKKNGKSWRRRRRRRRS